jgi:thymidylate synthase (FAD)
MLENRMEGKAMAETSRERAESVLDEMRSALGWCDENGYFGGTVSVSRDTLARWVYGVEYELEGMPNARLKPEVSFVGQSVEVLDWPDDAVGDIARAARTCYRSVPKDVGSDKALVRSLIASGHLSMLEFASATVRIRCDRAMTHELVRHRHFSFAQESQRYVNSAKKGFEFVRQGDFSDDPDLQAVLECVFERQCAESAAAYAKMVDFGVKPERARAVLPNAAASTITMRGNLRSWREFFVLRTDSAAHPMMQELAKSILAEFKALIPVVFDDLGDGC